MESLGIHWQLQQRVRRRASATNPRVSWLCWQLQWFGHAVRHVPVGNRERLDRLDRCRRVLDGVWYWHLAAVARVRWLRRDVLGKPKTVHFLQCRPASSLVCVV